MLIKGRACTVENGYMDDGLVTARSVIEIRKIGEWIRKNIRGSRSILHGYSSYGLKHLLEEDTGIYMTNNEFKDAMVLAGFQPVNPNALNWKFRISLTREINVNPSPFYKWAMRFTDEVSPYGDFARDMKQDFEFPVFAEHEIILDYLEMINACRTAIDVFENMWKDYEGKNS